MAEVTTQKAAKTATPPPPKPRSKSKTKKKPSVASQEAAREAAQRAAEPPFFDLVRSVPAADWGTRAFMYVYATEPICDLKKQGGYSYLLRSAQPILDLDGLMVDYGSFKGYMTLNRRKAGEDASDLIDKFDFEIYNPKHPPKIPRAAWLNDSRNARWAALLPPVEEQRNGSNSTVKEVLELVNGIEDRISARFEDSQQEPPDPTEQLKNVAEVFQGLKGESNGNGVIEIMKLFMTQQSATLAELRVELREARKAPEKPAEDPLTKKLLEKLVDDFIEGKQPDKEDRTERIERSRMSGMQEFITSITDSVLKSPVLANFSHGFMVFAMNKWGGPRQPAGFPPPPAVYQQPGPAPLPQVGAPGQPQPAQPEPGKMFVPAGMKLTPQQLAPFVGEIMQPLMNHIQNREKDGWDLAEFVMDWKGKDAYHFIQNQGEDVLMEAFRLSPFWSELAPIEPQLKEYIHQFCTWPPPADTALPDEEDDEPKDADGRVSLE